MSALTYQTLELAVNSGGAGEYVVAVLNSPAGQARGALALPSDMSRFQQLLAALDDARLNFSAQASSLAREAGAVLFDALFHDELRSAWDVSLRVAKDRGQGLRLQLRVNPPELALMPWELLFDEQAGAFVGLSRHTPIVRFLEVNAPPQTLTLEPPVNLLGVAASPADLETLDIDREKQRMAQALAGPIDAGLLTLTWLEPPTWPALQAALQADRWHVIHFIGHAEFNRYDGTGEMALHDAAGLAARRSAMQLAHLLGDLHSLRLIVLNACQSAAGHAAGRFSSMAGALVQRGLPAVVAMQYPVSDDAATEFSRAFYAALANFYPVDGAVAEARKAMNLAEPASVEWATPTLHLRAPDGALFQPAVEEASMNNPQSAPWWARLPDAPGQTGGPSPGGNVSGDVIIASVGSGARNVAIGKNITQKIHAVLGPSQPDDPAAIANRFAQLYAVLAGADPARREEGAYQLRRLEEELTGLDEDEAPRSRTIMKAGDWLLENLPELGSGLGELFGLAAVGRILGRSDGEVVEWVRLRFDQ